MAPGSGVKTDAEIADYVRDTAWGHHASCSCAIGPISENGVLDSVLARLAPFLDAVAPAAARSLSSDAVVSEDRGMDLDRARA